jgi:cytochrome c peroxidase
MKRICLRLAALVPVLIPIAAGIFSLGLTLHPRAQVQSAERPAPALSVEFDEKSLAPRERLGLRLFFDASLSEPAGLSCASCHDPAKAFSGNNGSTLGVALGSRPGVFGTRDTPTAMYLARAPRFGVIEKEGKKIPAGGLFWDGRADSLEEQAKGPFFNALEMNNPDTPALIAKVARAPYAAEFRKVWGEKIFSQPDAALDAVAASLAAFQRTRALQPFTSKFDYVMRGQAKFTEQEQRGLGLFTIRQKGNCAHCHIVDEASRDPQKSLFTDFSYHALRDESGCGLFKTPTLRNIALTAPYMHNGFFDKLRDAVAFYATRDTDPAKWFPEGKKFNDLPAPFHANVDVETPPYQRRPKQRPQLNDEEIDDIVAFLHTLTDGYKP